MSLTTMTTVAEPGYQNRPYYPKVRTGVHAIGLAPSSASESGPIHETHKHRQVRLNMHAVALGTGSTITVTVETGVTTSLGETVAVSSGAVSAAFNSTDAVEAVFTGLSRYTQVTAQTSTGSGHGSTDLRVDAEFI